MNGVECRHGSKERYFDSSDPTAASSLVLFCSMPGHGATAAYQSKWTDYDKMSQDDSQDSDVSKSTRMFKARGQQAEEQDKAGGSQAGEEDKA